MAARERDPDLLRKQLIGIAGALAALAVMLAAWMQAGALFARFAPAADDVPARLAFAARWLLVPGVALLVGVVGAARRGFFTDAIDGTRTPANHALEINLRYNQNTLEQALLATIAWTNLALALPHDRLSLVPAMAVLFAFGRLTFWVGYLIHPMGRAFGMTLTVLPTLVAIAWLVARAFD